MTVSVSIVGGRRLACRVWRDTRGASRGLHLLANGTAVVGCVRHDMARRQPFQQLRGARRVPRLAWREKNANDLSELIDDRMDFRGQPSARTTKTSPTIGFLFFSDG